MATRKAAGPERKMWWLLEGCRLVAVEADPSRPPKGAVAWCREGDEAWTRLRPELSSFLKG